MKTISLLLVLLPALGATFPAIQELLAHYIAGDLLEQSCTAAQAAAWSGYCPTNLWVIIGHLLQTLLGVGAVLSPGVAAFKLGIFKRPGA